MLERLGDSRGETLLVWNFPEGYEWPDGDLDELVQEFMQYASGQFELWVRSNELFDATEAVPSLNHA